MQEEQLLQKRLHQINEGQSEWYLRPLPKFKGDEETAESSAATMGLRYVESPPPRARSDPNKSGSAALAAAAAAVRNRRQQIAGERSWTPHKGTEQKMSPSTRRQKGYAASSSAMHNESDSSKWTRTSLLHKQSKQQIKGDQEETKISRRSSEASMLLQSIADVTRSHSPSLQHQEASQLAELANSAGFQSAFESSSSMGLMA